MRIKQHKESGLWVRDDGAVLMPPCPQIRRFRHTWTFGSKQKSTGYMRVRFRGKQYRVHKLVIGAFIENKLGLPTVDHINRIKTDNRLENLRYGSYKLQSDNRQIVEDSLEKYGVRKCDDRNAYACTLYAKNPEFAERQRTHKRERRARDPEVAKKECARRREWEAKQRAIGRRRRKCPDGSRRFLTDEEFNRLYSNSKEDGRCD